jgi:hypothetical protein
MYELTDPVSEYFRAGSRVQKIPDPDPEYPSKNSRILYTKYDLGCSSRIRVQIQILFPSRIPDPGSKKALDSVSATLHFKAQYLHWSDSSSSSEKIITLLSLIRLVFIPRFTLSSPFWLLVRVPSA